MNIWKSLLQLISFGLPWPVRRWLLRHAFGYRIDPTARIGFSLVSPSRLVMGPGAHIGSLTVIKGLSELTLDEGARLGNLNWVTGTPEGNSEFFGLDPARNPSLHIGRNASITHRHLIDCTDRVQIGQFATFAGWGSQILTHSIDVHGGRQRAAPVYVGAYTFVGTRVVILKGSTLPDYSILAAGSVLGSAETASYRLYSGVPAKLIRELDTTAKYFTRSVGRIY